MNENLERLLPNPFAVDYIGTDEPIDLYTEKEMLEFSQLIIQECARIAAEVGDSNVKLGYLVPRECSDKIKKHFGVKE